jgi:hypothetical protein
MRQSQELFRKAMVLYDSLTRKPRSVRRTLGEIELENGSKIFSLPGSNPDAVRGFSAPSLLIEDESAFVSDKTFIATRPFFATNPKGRHILLTTPYGRRGHFFDLWNTDGLGWEKITIKSEDCPRIGEEFLRTEKNILSDRAYRQEYECEFLDSAISVFPSDFLERLVDSDDRDGIILDDTPLPLHDPGPWKVLK